MKRSVLLLGLVLLYSFTLVAQKGTLKGSVKDKKTHEGLIGASILIKGTTVGTTTNLDGEYVIENVGAGKTTVVVSLVGYNTTESEIDIKANQTTSFGVELEEGLIQLNDLVITGVVNPKSALESSVAVTSLKPKALEKLGAVNTAEVFKS
ncbi:MAG: carboxypeptidase-like regulatory domain-containing protein, partial [Paludibacter sp.]